MTVTYESPTGSQLPSPDAVCRVTATSTVAFIVARFLAPAGKPKRAEEVVYRDGVFWWPYLASTKVGNVYTVQRQGGWPQDVELRVEEQTGGVSFGIPGTAYGKPTLTLALFGPVAQWGLLGRSWPSLRDRSGHDRHLTYPGVSMITRAGPDMVPGVVCPRNAEFLRAPDAALQITGELTVSLRAWFDETNTDYQVLIQCGTPGSTAPTNVLYTLFVLATGQLAYYAENAAGVAIHYTTNLYVARGRWQFYTLRRTAAGVVTIDLDDFTETSGALPAPTGGTSSLVYVSGDPGSTAGTPKRWSGGLADINVWNARLSDAQLAQVRAAMMALGPRPPRAYAATLYAPWAQWALDASDVLADRSGNARHLTTIANPAVPKVPSWVAGKLAYKGTSFTRAGFVDISRTMTICARVFLEDGSPPSGSGWIVANTGADTSYSSPLQISSERRLFGYNEAAGGAGTGSGSGFDLVLPLGQWVFVASRRRPDGRMLFNVDDQQQLTEGIAQPYGTGASQLYIGVNSFGAGNDAATEDVSVWSGTCLSDDELYAVRASMGMG